MPKLPSLILTALLAGCNAPPPDTHPDQPVTKRKVIFKQMTRTLEPMGLVARERKDYQPEAFLASAQELAALAAQPWAHFPPDSNYPPSRALPAVWEKATDFKQAQQDFQAATQQLIKAGEARDMALIQKAVNTVQDSCKACHDQFRRH